MSKYTQTPNRQPLQLHYFKMKVYDRAKYKCAHNLVLGLLLRRDVKNVPQARRRFEVHLDEVVALVLRC